MSELKATTAQEIVQNEKDCDYMDELFGGVKMPPTQVYLKSEADKVIADLKDKLQKESALLKETRDWLIESQKMHKRCADNAIKIIRRINRKRCLAMAKGCKESLRLMRTYEVTYDYWNLEPGHDAEYFCKKGDFYCKWRKRWLALAEEPTWAKFLQLIHKEAK